MDALHGRCLCGAVTFEVTQPFDSTSFCHCTTCKRISGGAGTVSGRVPTTAVRVVSGRDRVHTYQPDEGSAKSFCSRCGSNLFGSGWPHSEYTSVRLPAIDGPIGAVAASHIYVRSCAPWETLPDDGLDRHEGGRP